MSYAVRSARFMSLQHNPTGPTAQISKDDWKNFKSITQTPFARCKLPPIFFRRCFSPAEVEFSLIGPWICATLNGKSHRDVCMTIRAWFSRTSNLTFEGVCHFLVWLTIEPFRIPRRRLVLADHLLKKPFIIQRKSLQGMRKSLVEPYSENQNTNHTSMRWSTWSTYLSALL